MKKILKPALAALLAAALLLLIACSIKQESPKLEHNLLFFFNEAENATSFYADDKRLDNRIGGSISNLASVDGTEGLVIASSSLYRINTDGLLKIYPAAVTNAVPALLGGKILFATATMVHLYDEAAKDYVKLEGIEADSIVDLALSPSGSSAGITVLKGDSMVGYIYSNGSVREYGKRCIVALSDDAKTVYYLDTLDKELTGVLHREKDGKDSVISNEASPYFELNRDLTEITFDVKGKTHISRNGEAARKLVDSSVFSFAGAQRSAMGGKACTTLLKNTNTLLNGIFYSNTVGEDSGGNKYDMYNIYHIDGSLNASALALGATQFSVSSDSKHILTIVDDALYTVSAYNPRSPELIANNIYTFCCADDLSDVHCLDLGGNVRKLEGSSLSTVLVTGIDMIKRMADGSVLCYASLESGGTLFRLKDDRAEPVAVGVQYFEIYEHVVTYLTNYDETAQTYDLYISPNGVDFSLAEKNVLMARQVG